MALNFIKSIPYRVKGIIYGSTEGTQSLKELLRNHGSEQILAINVCRKPIQKMVEKFLNIASFGELNRVKSQLGYDHLMHLYCYITTDKGTHFLAEKNEIISIKYTSNTVEPGAQCMPVALPVVRPSVNDLFLRAQRAEGSRFFKYDSLNERGGTNCQAWITGLLQYSNLLTPQLNTFINQDIATIAKNAPPGFGNFASALTELASRFQIGILGHGAHLHKILSLHNSIMPHKWIQSAISHPGAFRELAKQHHALTNRGTIKKSFINAESHSSDPTIRRRAVLAHTLSRFHHNITGGGTRHKLGEPSHEPGTYGGGMGPNFGPLENAGSMMKGGKCKFSDPCFQSGLRMGRFQGFYRAKHPKKYKGKREVGRVALTPRKTRQGTVLGSGHNPRMGGLERLPAYLS